LGHKWPEYVAPSRPTNRGKDCKYSYKVSTVQKYDGKTGRFSKSIFEGMGVDRMLVGVLAKGRKPKLG
jgi:hypothetical protein